jgi:Protein of unknown function (DUF3102)
MASKEISVRAAAEIDRLAAEIRDQHEQAVAGFRSSVEHSAAAGERLLRVKAQVPHGEWRAWLEKNVPFSVRTAEGYMQLAREPNAQALAHLGIEGALKAIAQRSAKTGTADRRRQAPKHEESELSRLAKAINLARDLDVSALGSGSRAR